MLKAIIFDFNGVIVNDEPVHLKMFQKVLREEGIRLSSGDYYKNYLAFDDRSCFEQILSASSQSWDTPRIDHLVERKASYYRAYIREHDLVFPGASRWIRKLSASFPLAVASAALKAEIVSILQSAGLLDCFEAIVAAEDTKKSKPDPESYLLAFQFLRRTRPLGPEECLVIEDSIPGVEAAHLAGMKCAALAHTYPPAKLRHADLVFKNYADFSIEKIMELFSGDERGGLQARP